MMGKRKFSSALIVRFALFALLLQIGQSCSKTLSKQVRLSCREQLSGCGECEECQILEVMGDSVLNDNLKGQKLEYGFTNSELQDEFDRESPFCRICCTYVFNGDLEISGKTQKLRVAKFEISIDSTCCTINSPYF